MSKRFRLVASLAIAIALLGACSDDDDSSTTTSNSSSTTSEPAVGAILARGDDVELAGDVTTGIRNQTLNIDAYLQDGKATGEIRIADNVIRVECADASLDGRVVLGGTTTAGSYLAVDELYALIVTEGDPDSVALVGNDSVSL